MYNWDTLHDSIVNGNYCCGCGLCAGICPQKAIKMQLDTFGEYKPEQIKNCVNCGLCYKVCPFSDEGPNENNIAAERFSSLQGIIFNQEIGYYLKNYLGYSSDTIRLQSASGGLLTWTLLELINKHEIDYAICVRPVTGPGKLFEFTVCNSVEEIKQCSKSCYYPVELSTAIQFILRNEGRYAVVGLPCMLKAIMKAEYFNNKLKSRIKYHLGLICGQQKSTFFTDYLCLLGGGNPKKLTNVLFRLKDKNRKASDFGMSFKCFTKNDQTFENKVFWTEGIKEAWCSGYFKLNACNYCDDLYAETADASYMDAWLPQYSNDPAGTSIVVLRNLELLQKFESATVLKDIYIEKIGTDKVVLSQIGALKFKRDNLALRLALAKKHQLHPPMKRINPATTLTYAQQVELNLHNTIIHSSKHVLKKQMAIGNGLYFFKLYMYFCKLHLLAIQKVLKHKYFSKFFLKGGV